MNKELIDEYEEDKNDENDDGYDEYLSHCDDVYDDYVNEYLLKTREQLIKRIERLKKALKEIQKTSTNTKLAPSLRCEVIAYKAKTAISEDKKIEKSERK